RQAGQPDLAPDDGAPGAGVPRDERALDPVGPFDREAGPGGGDRLERLARLGREVVSRRGGHMSPGDHTRVSRRKLRSVILDVPAMLLTVRNVGRILDLYSVDTPERGPSEVAAELGMGKSKAHALMASMAEIGLLRRVAGGRYRAGWRAL